MMVENRPIVGTAMKTRRIKSKEPVDERCWAYMRELRQHYKGRACYPVNPYAEVYPVRKNTYAILNESLDGAGDVWMYLIVGPEKALLVDTGFGLGDLKGLCSQLSGGKELIVANTHPHLDHAFGNSQFERVYCHEYAVPTLQKMNTPDMWDHLFDENGKAIWADFDKKDLIGYRAYEIVGVPDGYTFNLGGDYEVELIFTAGHASGHCMFLDKTTRLLFAGDDVLSMRVGISGPRAGDPYGQYATVTAYRDQMAKLAKRINEFDYIFPGHFVFELENYVIEDLVKAANEIIADPNCYQFKEETMNKAGPIVRMNHWVPGLGTIGYTENAIYSKTKE